MSTKNKMISEMGLTVLSERRHAKLTGITRRDSIFPPMWVMLIFVGVFFGVFGSLMVLRPDLINWHAFNQAFLLGIIMGMR